MCDPATILSLALTAAGSVAKIQQENSASKARAEMLRAENERQQKMQEEAANRLFQTEQGLTIGSQTQNLNDITANRTADLQKSVTPVNAYVPVADSTPQIVKSEIAKKLGEALASGKSSAQRMANLGAWGENQFANAINLNRSRADIGNIGTNMMNSSNILPIELEEAKSAGAGWGTLGDILGAAGTFTGAAAARGWNPFASAKEAAGGGGFLSGALSNAIPKTISPYGGSFVDGPWGIGSKLKAAGY